MTKNKLFLLALTSLIVGCTCPECPTTPCPTNVPCETCPTALTTLDVTNTATIVPTPTATPGPSQTPANTPIPMQNLLINAGFEGGVYQESANLFVPLGWRPWSSCSGTELHSELEAHPPHVRHGSFAARVWQAYNTCSVGLFQQVDALPGASYQFMGYGFSWSTSKPVVGTPSEAYIKAWVGIDPLGGTDPLAASVIWSDENAARDVYGEFMVTVTARHTRITVFMRSKPDWGLARNDTFWDDMTLYQVALPDSNATPAPTQTPTIIEVTPVGGDPVLAAGDKMEDVRGIYTPKGVQNVRDCAVAGVGCSILYRLGAGLPVEVYGRVTVYPSGDVWLCLDTSINMYGEDVGSQCGKVVAYKIGSTTFGELVLDKEQ